MKVLVVGKGNMAQETMRVCVGHRALTCSLISEKTDFEKGHFSNGSKKDTIAIHFGSGRLLPQLIEICEEYGVPIIQGSTNGTLPTKVGTTIINAPNLSLPMLRFMRSFPAFAEALRHGMITGLMESHQGSKEGVSGTARALVPHLDIPPEKIVSVRDADVQMGLGVPTEYLGGHAYHYFTFTGQGVNITLQTKIHGRETYAKGALRVAEVLLEKKALFADGVYQLVATLELLDLV